ncbi:single-pass membrane and coiled-coil domain-containing protein 1, partial [Ornithorhynchus anatinus]|uniref:single-pass membrane and coiled-coil domain-containing protein 1 n=1 Tax=Ornithorhynchus anatinus TaxID=9258 RepID=UPI0019D4B7F5
LDLTLTPATRRVERKLETLEIQFGDLDRAKENLTHKFKLHGETLRRRAAQDEMWVAVLDDRLAALELNVLYGYVVELFHYLHSQVLEKVPDLRESLPTFTSILRRKDKNRRIGDVWESVLEVLGWQEGHVRALCAFFVARGREARYCRPSRRLLAASEVTAVMTDGIKNPLLRESLLRAVQTIEKGRTTGAPM